MWNARHDAILLSPQNPVVKLINNTKEDDAEEQTIGVPNLSNN